MCDAPPGELKRFSACLIDETAPAGNGAVKVTALGTTMMLVDDGTTQIVLDPFLTPVGLLEAGLNRPVKTDEGQRQA